MEAFFDFFNTVPCPFNIFGFLVMVVIVCALIHHCYTAYLDHVLKREMLSKDLTAEDIERIINSGKGKPEIEDKTSEIG